MDKKIELAKKIKALADKGFEGEKVSANEMLIAFMEKHGLSFDELENDQINKYYFEVDTTEEIKLFHQIVVSVCGKNVSCYKVKGVKARVFSEMTYFQKVEVEIKYHFYSKLFQDELKIFYAAFIQKNNIFPEGRGTDINDLSNEERQKAKRILEMSQNIKKGEVHKQIER